MNFIRIHYEFAAGYPYFALGISKSKELPQKAADAINVADNVFFSPVNLWEIGIKSAIWPEFGIKRIEDIHAGALKSNLQELLINSVDAMLATQLATIHRDPFDRLLIAQSHNRQYHLVTVDDKIAQYQLPYILSV